MNKAVALVSFVAADANNALKLRTQLHSCVRSFAHIHMCAALLLEMADEVMNVLHYAVTRAL